LRHENVDRPEWNTQAVAPIFDGILIADQKIAVSFRPQQDLFVGNFFTRKRRLGPRQKFAPHNWLEVVRQPAIDIQILSCRCSQRGSKGSAIALMRARSSRMRIARTPVALIFFEC